MFLYFLFVWFGVSFLLFQEVILSYWMVSHFAPSINPDEMSVGSSHATCSGEHLPIKVSVPHPEKYQCLYWFKLN